MSAENVAVVRRWFEGLSRGDPMPEICDEQFMTRNWDDSPIPGPYHGHQGLHRWWADFSDVIEDARMVLKEVVPVDAERVVTTQRVVGRFRHTGIEVDGPFGAIVTVRDGKILSAIGYSSPGRAKKAAGLERPHRS